MQKRIGEAAIEEFGNGWGRRGVPLRDALIDKLANWDFAAEHLGRR